MQPLAPIVVNRPLETARQKLYEIAGGSIGSGNVKAAQLSTKQRIQFFQTPEFRHWVAFEKAMERVIFWLKDVDKTQSAGDIFTYFFKWRADNNMFSEHQLQVIAEMLLGHRNLLTRTAIRSIRAALSASATVGLNLRAPRIASLTPYDVLDQWWQKEEGKSGLSLYDFWAGAYWPSQFGLTKDEKASQCRAFIPNYASKVYPGVREENQLLEELGVNVVIVSNGDQELAIAASETLGIKPENVVGSHLKYDENGISTGVNHSYEVFLKDWNERPQPGKALSFHYWLHMNRKRFGWDHLDDRKWMIGGRDGDSAASDGGMMMLLHPAALGNFMIDTPGEPDRLEKFYKMAAKYGWTKGQFFTLLHESSLSSRKPE